MSDAHRQCAILVLLSYFMTRACLTRHEILVTRCSTVTTGLTKWYVTYVRKDFYLRGTMYVWHCAREENASLCSPMLSVL